MTQAFRVVAILAKKIYEPDQNGEIWTYQGQAFLSPDGALMFLDTTDEEMLSPADTNEFKVQRQAGSCVDKTHRHLWEGDKVWYEKFQELCEVVWYKCGFALKRQVHPAFFDLSMIEPEDLEYRGNVLLKEAK